MTIKEIIEKYGLHSQEKEEFLHYLKNEFTSITKKETDDVFLEKWQKIMLFAKEHSTSEALNLKVCPKRPVKFIEPERIRMELYESFAGIIPVIYILNVMDFEQFITNSIYKGNAPENLSQTGASFAFGKTTRFIVLSSKPYSNIPACELGLDESDWAEKSMIIRREHECTHYFTRRLFGIARNHLHDELIADFFGLYEAFGEYRAEYFLRFMGIIGNSGGRLKFYIAELNPNLYRAIEETARSASAFLEQYTKTDVFLSMNRKERVETLCNIGLAEMCDFHIRNGEDK